MWYSILAALLLVVGNMVETEESSSVDVFKTKNAEGKIHVIGHGSLMIEYNELNIHVDPCSAFGDYANLPKADLILITHHHYDHLDSVLIQNLKNDNTKIFLTQKAKDILGEGKVMKNGSIKRWKKIGIEAVPAYNIVHTREDGSFYHPKGEGNGYILDLDGTRIYIAGDTENIPEMATFRPVDIAFLPMNLPYTMDVDMACLAAMTIMPKVLYPYHYRETNLDDFLKRMKDIPQINVRIRDWYLE